MKTMIKNITKKDLSFNLVLFLVICVGIFYRISIYLHNQSFWGDEILLGMNMIDKTFSELFVPLLSLQVAPPVFLVISKFLFEIARNTGNVDYTDLALRFIPMISSVSRLVIPLICSDILWERSLINVNISTVLPKTFSPPMTIIGRE